MADDKWRKRVFIEYKNGYICIEGDGEKLYKRDDMNLGLVKWELAKPVDENNPPKGE
jgi:hypothetical protein